MNRFTTRLAAWMAVVVLAVPFSASAHGHSARRTSAHAADPIFQRGGGPVPVVRTARTDLKHERVAHRNTATDGIHYRPVRTR